MMVPWYFFSIDSLTLFSLFSGPVHGDDTTMTASPTRRLMGGECLTCRKKSAVRGSAPTGSFTWREKVGEHSRRGFLWFSGQKCFILWQTFARLTVRLNGNHKIAACLKRQWNEEKFEYWHHDGHHVRLVNHSDVNSSWILVRHLTLTNHCSRPWKMPEVGICHVYGWAGASCHPIGQHHGAHRRRWHTEQEDTKKSDMLDFWSGFSGASYTSRHTSIWLVQCY